MSVRTINDLDPQGQRVLIRVDFNVPLRSDGTVLDDRRIRMALPTLHKVIDRGGIAICMSHLGRPAGTGPEPAFSMAPVVACLQSLVGPNHKVHAVVDACRGDVAATAVASASPGDIVLLDNLRFEACEKAGDECFAQAIASLGDAYVNDAFGTAHRDHASMVALPRAMQGKPCVAGLLFGWGQEIGSVSAPPGGWRYEVRATVAIPR